MDEPQIRRATPGDLQDIRRLQDECIRWLAEKGTDQWQPTAMSTVEHQPSEQDQSLAASIDRQEVYVAVLQDGVIGTFTLNGFADPELWDPEDGPAEALYLHRMIVKRSLAGHGIGQLIIDYAARCVTRAGKQLLRLDAWKTNHALHDYYRSQGFRLVRITDLPHRKSGALFEMSTS